MKKLQLSNVTLAALTSVNVKETVYGNEKVADSVHQSSENTKVNYRFEIGR